MANTRKSLERAARAAELNDPEDPDFDCHPGVAGVWTETPFGDKFYEDESPSPFPDPAEAG